MEQFKNYLKNKIEGCKATKAPYRDKIIYELVLDEYSEQLILHDVSNRREQLIAFMDHYRDNDGMGKRDIEAIDDFLLGN